MTKDKIKSEVFMMLAIIMAVVLAVAGGLALWGGIFVSNMVSSELSAQKIYFPEKGSKALDPVIYHDLQQYAGQRVDTPEKAKAYANGYIGRHLEHIAAGKTYAEISTLATKDPSNQKLQEQKQTLFQGETLRTLLLTSGYGFGTAGSILKIVAYLAFALGGALLLLAFVLRARL